MSLLSQSPIEFEVKILYAAIIVQLPLLIVTYVTYGGAGVATES